MANAREWISAILTSKVIARTFMTLGVLAIILWIDWSLEYLISLFTSCLIGFIIVGFINSRRIKRGQSPLGGWPYLLTGIAITAIVDILT